MYGEPLVNRGLPRAYGACGAYGKEMALRDDMVLVDNSWRHIPGVSRFARDPVFGHAHYHFFERYKIDADQQPTWDGETAGWYGDGHQAAPHFDLSYAYRWLSEHDLVRKSYAGTIVLRDDPDAVLAILLCRHDGIRAYDARFGLHYIPESVWTHYLWLTRLERKHLIQTAPHAPLFPVRKPVHPLRLVTAAMGWISGVSAIRNIVGNWDRGVTHAPVESG